jgi:hypothetical protein
MAAGSTYTPIATTTISGSSTTEVTFSSISGYTDLVCVANTGPLANISVLQVRFNNDSGNNYSYTQFSGNGSATAATVDQNQAYALASGTLLDTTNRTMHIMYVNDYANTTTYKTLITRGNRAADTSLAAVSESAVVWRSTSAITSYTIRAGGEILPAGSTFTLYGLLGA